MCGIAGIFRLSGRPAAEDAAAVLRMMDAQIHRGPDDWGILAPGSLAADPGFRSLVESRGSDHLRLYPHIGPGPSAILGTRRLSILDLSQRGRMPMGSADGRLWIAHNGEIYNYRELRAELDGRGASFHSETDTEAVLRGYAAWDEAVLPRLRGMFALALFEAGPRPRLLLARDRFGIKPLYYHQDRERLVFASEVRALLQSGMVPDEADMEALARFLQLGSVPMPKTTVRDVAALPTGHSLMEAAYSEASYARMVATRYGTTHHEVVLRAHDLFDGMPRIFAAMDEPTVDGVNTYFVSEAAKRAGLRVVLSGTGGDELFFGYGHFRRGKSLDRIRRFLAAVPVQARWGLIQAARYSRVAVGRSGLDRLEYLEQPSLDNLYLMVRGLFGPRQVQDLLGVGEREFEVWGPPWPPLDQSRAGGMLGAFGLLEFTHYLQNQLLKDTDVMSMAHSVEARVPYLDHRLVEYVAGLPSAVKLDGDRPKPLLLDALGDALPREVWNRPKMGFTFPFGPWMRQRAFDLKAISASSTWLERSAVEAIWEAYRAGRLHWSRPWALVVLAAFEACRKTAAAA